MPKTEKNILIAEQESDTRRFIVSSLKKDNCVVICTDSGRDVMRIVEERYPDIVISDTELKDVSGFDVCKQIKNDDSPYKDVPVILLSDRTSLQDRLRGFLAGADKYICKPFSIEDFQAATAFLMDRKAHRPKGVWAETEDYLSSGSLSKYA